MLKKDAQNIVFIKILIDFIMIFVFNSGTIELEKIQKNEFWGLYPGLNCV
jgi:hypothetical protein